MLRCRKSILLSIGIVIAFTFSVFSQHQILRGKVVNERTKGSLPFVNIEISGTHHGTASDIDGRFEISIPLYATELVFSYVGYESSTHLLRADQPYIVRVFTKYSLSSRHYFQDYGERIF